MEIQAKYESYGVVYGKYWGGGNGSYSAKKFNSHSKEELIKLNEQALEDGSLDGGMGFERLIVALITIKTIKSITIDDEIYSNTGNYEKIIIGYLTDKEIEFLKEIECNF